MSASVRADVHLRRVAGATVEALPGAGPDLEEPGPGWRRGKDTTCTEWIRDDNRVVINDRGGRWQAYMRAERSVFWDRIEQGEMEDDGRRHYPPVGSPSDTLWGAVLEVGALFAVLPGPLPDPDAP